MSISLGRNAPLSPISIGGSDFSVSKYQNPDDGYIAGRPNLASPPNSGGSNSTMSLNGFPSVPMNGPGPGPGPGPRSTGRPSPPASIARSSNGTQLFAGSESGRNSVRGDLDEAVLSEHYVALRTFLNTRDPNHKQQPNKARDKLLRLSSVQFYELSTDVFDELIRRQAAARAPPNAPNGPPSFLLPEKNFHPKRNQARQRLSSLGPPRFRDLAADVYHELERRFPRFVSGDFPRPGSSMSMRGPGTPVNGNGNGFAPRNQSRMRRPSDAPSMRGPGPTDAYGVPASPGVPNGDYGRPTPKQLNQNNTLVPNKSTMVEEDDEGEEFAEQNPNRESKRSAGSGVTSETDKKLIEDYQNQVRELRERLDSMEDSMKKKEDEMNSALDQERSRATSISQEKQEWSDLRLNLENKLAEAQSLNDSMKQELQRVREEHENEIQRLKEDVAVAQDSPRNEPGASDSELQRENDELRQALREQQMVTEEFQKSMLEMREISQQSSATHERHAELDKTITSLEREVQEWKNRYASAKTQLRHMRATSAGPGIEQNAAKHLREKGFMDDRGLVKDIHVTKFQLAIDELLEKARTDDPEKVVDAMKVVVVSVRRITKDIQVPQEDEDFVQQQTKIRAKVSSTANNLITASKNFAHSAGMSPVSLLDTAATHLAAAIVELLRLVKIRATPAEELDDDDGTETPADSSGLFSPVATEHNATIQDSLPAPPAFQGLSKMRQSIESSTYSPLGSPRQSADPYAHQRSMSKSSAVPVGLGHPGNNQVNGQGSQQLDPRAAEDLKLYLEDQNAYLSSDIQKLVNTIRGDAEMRQITDDIAPINAVVSQIISETQAYGLGDLTHQLANCRARLLEAADQGQDMANIGMDTNSHEWRMWVQTLPPIAFGLARESKELVQEIDNMAGPGRPDDFS
ncbi:GRIP1 associated protein [Fusarium heterosporum]|uniref:GRIP1 associated protein n=1 Tax=Fusarium heterosporum TaxID=42747 RepID=A0A8H5WSY9_FUSHE|nr:GRIP1 associated protein [Fusarium heterosporum]